MSLEQVTAAARAASASAVSSEVDAPLTKKRKVREASEPPADCETIVVEPAPKRRVRKPAVKVPTTAIVVGRAPGPPEAPPSLWSDYSNFPALPALPAALPGPPGPPGLPPRPLWRLPSAPSIGFNATEFEEAHRSLAEVAGLPDVEVVDGLLRRVVAGIPNALPPTVSVSDMLETARAPPEEALKDAEALRSATKLAGIVATAADQLRKIEAALRRPGPCTNMSEVSRDYRQACESLGRVREGLALVTEETYRERSQARRLVLTGAVMVALVKRLRMYYTSRHREDPNADVNDTINRMLANLFGGLRINAEDLTDSTQRENLLRFADGRETPHPHSSASSAFSASSSASS